MLAHGGSLEIPSEKGSQFVFYNNIDSFWQPFLLNFLEKSCMQERENKLRHHQIISTVCSLTDHGSHLVSVQKITQLL